MPLYFGGISERALRRTARVGQGWFGTGQTEEEAVEILGKIQKYREEYGTANEPFDAMVPLVVPPDPDLFARLAEKGMTSTTLYPFLYTLGPTSTLDQKRDAMMRFSEAFIQR